MSKIGQKHSKGAVARAGKTLISTPDDLEKVTAAMDILSWWRISHESALEQALSTVKSVCEINPTREIVGKRLKRLPAILEKLRRFEDDNMTLKNMHDIAGFRVVFNNKKNMIKAVRKIKKSSAFEVNGRKPKMRDYVSSPKKDGYRSVHFDLQFYNNENEQRYVEAQFRTKIQHSWATMVEMIDICTNQSIKTQRGDENWKKFFISLGYLFERLDSISNFENLTDKQKVEKSAELILLDEESKDHLLMFNTLSRRLNVAKKLVLYTRSLEIIGKMGDIDGYVMIEIDLDKMTINTKVFNKTDVQSAEREYAKIELKSIGKNNNVIALVSTENKKSLEDAYPNYFANTRYALEQLSLLAALCKELPWLVKFTKNLQY